MPIYWSRVKLLTWNQEHLELAGNILHTAASRGVPVLVDNSDTSDLAKTIICDIFGMWTNAQLLLFKRNKQ